MTVTLSPLRPGVMLHRTIDLGRAAVNATDRTVEIAFSSEAPVERYFGTEILDHSPKSVRLGRLNNGGAVLVEHDRNRQIGVIVAARIDADRVGRAVIRFGKGPLAEEIFQDVKDGIRRLVSVGYRIHKQETESKTVGVEAVRVTDWEPYELSLVAIPADDSVGVGRGLSDPTNSNIQNKVNTPTTENLDPAAIERTRTTRILAMAEQGQRQGITVDANRAIADGLTPEQFREQLFEGLVSRNTPYTPGHAAPEYSRSEQRDMSRYSICRAITRASAGHLDGLELEMSQDVARNMGKAASGFYIPFSALTGTRAMSVTGDSGNYGGAYVPTMVTGFIDALRPFMATAQAGATVLNALTSNIAIPRQSAASTASWKSEVATLDEATPTIDQLELSPKRCGAFTVLSKQLLIQSSPDVENLVRNDLLQACAQALDAAAINGSGADNQPTGILNTSGIGSVAGGTSGAAPTWAHIVALVAAIEGENVLGGNLAFITNSKVAAKLRSTPKVASTDSRMILELADLLGRPVHLSSNVPSNLVKGSSGAVCSAIIFGDWSNVVLASFGAGIDILADPFTNAVNGQVRIIANSYVDVGVRRAKAFAAAKDMLTA